MTVASSINDGSNEIEACVCVPIAYVTHETKSMRTSASALLLSFSLGMLVSAYVNVLAQVFSVMISSCWLVLLSTTSVLLLLSYLALRYFRVVAIFVIEDDDDDDGETGGGKDMNNEESWDARVPIILFWCGFVIGHLIFIGLSDASHEAIIIADISPLLLTCIVLVLDIIVFDTAKAKGKLDPRITLEELNV
jgi:hypothetical protein